MFWSLLLLFGSHVDMLNNPDDVRICAAGTDMAADEAAAMGSDEINVLILREIAAIFVERLDGMGAGDAAALAAAKARLAGGPEETAILEKCGAIVGAMRGDDSLLDAARRLDAGDDAAGDGAVDDAAADDPIDGPALLGTLSDVRRAEVRCAVLAGTLVQEVARGAATDAHGLTAEKADTLAGRLAEAIMAETGWSGEEMRAVYGADFEAYSAVALEDDASADFERAIAGCRPLYDGIDVSGEGDGAVPGLAPAARAGGVDLFGPDQCYALLSAFASGMPKGAKERKEFEAMAARLEPRVLGGAAKASAEGKARLAAAHAGFDAAAFEALDEPQAEAQIEHCFGLAS
ncbi:MAG TPA: hypothetical protein PKD99_15965 [Sphingopyxis sp.]|nr:hypothetical protein [Sphingopyxis sp.]HMP46596.1 hypothetical protein [Sphingopyxis sp.]HMQ20428.1 hypothetical protein [Sphingopyxis sp.]